MFTNQMIYNMIWLERRVESLIYKFSGNINLGDHQQFPLHLNYESGKYRQSEIRRIIQDTLPHFALTPAEYQEYTESGDDGEKMRMSWNRISKRYKYSKGDYGELLLFLILKVFFKSEKLVTKVKLKTSAMQEVNGYDCAHFTIEDNVPTLWLGESKFHKNFSTAISDAVKSLNEHCTKAFTKTEFSFLEPNIETNKDYPHHNEIRALLKNIKSFDEIKIKVPTFITYELDLIKNHEEHTTPQFIIDFEKEFDDKFSQISKKKISHLPNFELIFILLPLEDVAGLKDEIDLLEKANR